jgi:hypothetical protein
MAFQDSPLSRGVLSTSGAKPDSGGVHERQDHNTLSAEIELRFAKELREAPALESEGPLCQEFLTIALGGCSPMRLGMPLHAVIAAATFAEHGPLGETFRW